MASEAYGSLRTFFVTNGTSTANKDRTSSFGSTWDLVLIDRDCHSRIITAWFCLVAYPVYLDSYQLKKYSIYGAVPLEQILKKLLVLKAAGRLDKVKMLLLTIAPLMDGLQCTASHGGVFWRSSPIWVFLWDEAWFAFRRIYLHLQAANGNVQCKKAA